MAPLRAFGAFWYDFLVGDRMELFVGPIAALALIWLLLQLGVGSAIAALMLFAGISLVGLASVLWVARRAEK